MKRFGFLALIVVATLLTGTLAMAAPFDITTADGNGADSEWCGPVGPSPSGLQPL